LEILKAIILGIVQGFTEFFPVSSSGHLVIVPYIFGWDYIPVYYAVSLHFATLLSLVAVFYREIWRIIRAFFSGIFRRDVRKNNTYFRLSLFIIIASVPAAVAGFFIADFVEEIFSSPFVVGIFMLLTAAFLFLGEFIGKKMEQRYADTIKSPDNKNNDNNSESQVQNFKGFSYSRIVIIGIGQAIAILPGISRSGTTISFARFFGLKRDDCVRFSMLLSIPVILGAFIFELVKASGEIAVLDAQTIIGTIAGFIFAFISGFIAIKFLIRYTKSRNLNLFGIYCIFMAIVVFILTATRMIQ
jgi:undecaprenyl-diphosphatase